MTTVDDTLSPELTALPMSELTAPPMSLCKRLYAGEHLVLYELRSSLKSRRVTSDEALS